MQKVRACVMCALNAGVGEPVRPVDGGGVEATVEQSHHQPPPYWLLSHADQ